MAYFPESIMPAKLKDESQDIKGNKFIVSASDFNKHDEEIRSIEKVIGIKPSNFPGPGFSGVGNDSVNGFSGFSAYGSSYFGFSSCNSTDIFQATSALAEQLQVIRDEMVLNTSGIIAVTDANVPGANGQLSFPTNWKTTTLVDSIADNSAPFDEGVALDDLDYVTLANVSDMPDSGYITIINDVSMMTHETLQRGQYIPGLTGFVSTGSSIYSNTNIPVVVDAQNQFNNDTMTRTIVLGTNVEILHYSGIDVPNNRILNVRRRQCGTSSTRHAASDKVFKGRLVIQVSPILYVSDVAGGITGVGGMQVEVILRSNGKVEMRHRNRDTAKFFSDNTLYAYASYQACLIRSFDLLPEFDPTAGC